MEIFKKEEKNGCVFTVLQLPSRQTDRQRGREAGLNNYNNATDPECGENFFLVSCKSGNWNNCHSSSSSSSSRHANQFHAFPHSALLAFQTSNRQAVCEMKHCVVVSGVFVNKGGESRDNDYDGKEESERDINIISKFDRKLTLLCD
ncbi:hypothetical protein T08_3030 [Trichinella sp. T8]|nr:hypothetical protein T08_3030 [Trichinella sp. T8]